MAVGNLSAVGASNTYDAENVRVHFFDIGQYALSHLGLYGDRVTGNVDRDHRS